MSAFFAQKTSEEHLASSKSPSRQNPQIQETNFGNSVSCNGYAENGFNQMSQRLHHFIREHIVRGTWQKKERPILLNSWEASYFDISEKKLL